MTAKFLKVAAASVAIVAGFASTGAQAATGSANATAEILAAVQITNPVDLRFGSVAPPTAGSGSVSVAAFSGSTASCAGGAVCGGTSGPGSFDITGAGGLDVAVSLPSTSVTIISGVNSMSVTGLSLDTGLLFGGIGTVYVGGTLTVPTGQAAGVYSGSFNVDANYQ